MTQPTKHNTDNVVSIITDEEKAFEFMMIHYHRVVLLDEMNDKALDRAGKVGTAVRELLGAVTLYSRMRDGAKIVRLER